MQIKKKVARTALLAKTFFHPGISKTCGAKNRKKPVFLWQPERVCLKKGKTGTGGRKNSAREISPEGLGKIPRLSVNNPLVLNGGRNGFAGRTKTVQKNRAVFGPQ
jgi:hypothetical protein